MEVAGHHLTLLIEGPDRLEALIRLIDEAQKSLRLLYYIWNDDVAGRSIRDALLRAIQRGVTVSVLVDGFGVAASPAFFAPLVEANSRFCLFVPRYGRRYLLRNHQKLALADGRRVIIGGFNIADEYFGTAADNAWRDLGLLVDGDSVARLAPYFDDLFAWAVSPRPRMRALRRILRRHSIKGGKFHWLLGGPTRRLSPWARSVRRDMQDARRLDLIAAYFAPGPGLLRRAADVARRGSFRLVTAAKSDNNATIGAARHSYWLMLRRGVRVFE